MITHEIIGDDMQAVIVNMTSGDEVRAEAGAMTFMTDGIQMDARMQGGLLGGLKRLPRSVVQPTVVVPDGGTVLLGGLKRPR